MGQVSFKKTYSVLGLSLKTDIVKPTKCASLKIAQSQHGFNSRH